MFSTTVKKKLSMDILGYEFNLRQEIINFEQHLP